MPDARPTPPLVGLPACAREVNGAVHHSTPARYAEAVLAAAGALPVMIPPLGEAALALLDRLDGLLLPGSPSNVHPSRYGVETSETPDFHDPARDDTTLPLIREALRRGMPLLAICRGHQELNVALGGTLHQQVHLVTDRLDHRGQGTAREERYAPFHEITVQGGLARVLGGDRVRVNSVHGQAIDRLAPGLVVEATAADGTVEAVRVADAGVGGFAYGVQWHPEWRCTEDPVSTALFRAFGDACRRYARWQDGAVREAA